MTTTTTADKSSVFGADGPPEPVSLVGRYPSAAQLIGELSTALSDIPSDGTKASLAKREKAGRIVRKAIEDLGKIVTAADRRQRNAPVIRQDDAGPGASDFPDGTSS